MARYKFAAERNTVKHNRGTGVFEAGNIRFGLENWKLGSGDGGVVIHVLEALSRALRLRPPRTDRNVGAHQTPVGPITGSQPQLIVIATKFIPMYTVNTRYYCMVKFKSCR